MSVNPVSTANNAATVAAFDSTVVRQRKTSLGSDDFMKLLAVQFQSQDPMKPMEDTAFIAQMAQFSALDQSNSMVREMALLRSDQQNLAATGFLGRMVTVSNDAGQPVIGQVDAIENTSAGPALVIDGVKYTLSSVTRVELPPPPPAMDLPPAA